VKKKILHATVVKFTTSP